MSMSKKLTCAEILVLKKIRANILKKTQTFSQCLYSQNWNNSNVHHRKMEKQIVVEYYNEFSSVQFSCSVVSNSLWPMNCSTPGLPVHHQLLEFTKTHVHRVSNAIQSSHPLSSPSPPAPSRSQHQSLLQWVDSSHEVAKVLEFQLQHQSFQWTPRTDLL